MNKINTAIATLKIRKELGKLPNEVIHLIYIESKKYLERKKK